MQKGHYTNKGYRKDISYNKIFIISGIILIVAVIFLIIFLLFGRENEPGEKENGNEQPKLATNAVLPINQMVDRYFEAKSMKDSTALMSLIYPMIEIDEKKLAIEAELVEDYLNVVCYTLPGLSDDSYAVWVEFEYKFHGIVQPAPALNRLYAVKSEETGEYQIYASPDEAVTEHMESLSAREDIIKLTADIEARLQKALETDETLMNFYRQLQEEVADN